jgi:hypothetical protein
MHHIESIIYNSVLGRCRRRGEGSEGRLPPEAGNLRIWKNRGRTIETKRISRTQKLACPFSDKMVGGSVVQHLKCLF